MPDRKMTLVEYLELYRHYEGLVGHLFDMAEFSDREEDWARALECQDVVLDLRDGARFLVARL